MTTAEVTGVRAARMLGVSYRQIDYWVRECGFDITRDAAGSGSRRALSHDDVRRLDIAARLSRANSIPNDLRHVADETYAQWPEGHPAPDHIRFEYPPEYKIDPLIVTVRTFEEIAAE